MLRLKYLTAPCLAAVSLALLTFTSPAMAVTAGFTMTFDEQGNCSSTFGTCTGVFEADPTGTVSGNVWVFSFPTLTFTGNDVNVLDPNGVTISDRLRWIDPNNSFSSCDPTSGLAGCATHMIFYSLDDVTYTFGATTNSVTENADGTFQLLPLMD